MGKLVSDREGWGEFDKADEEAVEMLADWAGIAIEHARLYESLMRGAFSSSGRCAVSKPRGR